MLSAHESLEIKITPTNYLQIHDICTTTQLRNL